MNKRLQLIFLILLTMLQMFCFWHIDISYGAMNTDHLLTNGFAYYDPMVVFHSSLYGAIVISIILVIAIAHYIGSSEKTSEN